MWFAALLYPAWLAMMAVHEAGHVLHAWASGGEVARVRLPLLGFSQTDLSHNPHPHFIAWGGPVWGCVLPAAAAAALSRAPRQIRRAAQFFAGFCLICNGAYIGVGWVYGSGDAGDLLDYGTPVWVMIAFGLAAGAAGLWVWHRLTLRVGPVAESSA